MFASRNLVVVCRRSAVCGALTVIMGCLSAVACAQNYRTLPVELEPREASRLKTEFNSARKNPAGFGAAEADVESYLKKSFFPSMTLFTDEALMELASSREDLIGNWIPQATNPAVREYLVEQALFFARGMARLNFHPAVRYNAVLMLGGLDQQSATATAPAVPLVKATQELLELIEQEQFNKIPVPESVKLGALIGLERHSRLGIDPSLKERTTKAMLKVAGSETPEDVDSNVHDWLRRTAAQVLANLSAQGPTKEVQAALTALIADKKVGLDERTGTAAALTRITYPAGADIDGAAATNAVAQLTLDVITDAAKLAREYQDEALEGADLSSGPAGRGGYGGGEYGGRGGYGGFGRGGGEEEAGPRFERRQLFARLLDIGTGSGSLAVGLADEPKARLVALIDELKPVMQIMQEKNESDVEVSKKVIELETALTTLLESWGQPVVEADNKPAKEGDAVAEN